MPTSPIVYRVKFKHRPHYAGFTACTFHALQLSKSGAVEVEIVEPKDLLPLPAHAVAAGHTHCYTCNREKGIGLSHHPDPRVAQG